MQILIQQFHYLPFEFKNFTLVAVFTKFLDRTQFNLASMALFRGKYFCVFLDRCWFTEFLR